MSTGMIWKSGYRFSDETMLKHNVQQQSGRWAQRARCPCYPKGWKPSELQKPWQDRRTLISCCDQRPAILHMVFVFGASLLS
jgi:hypothetical protein